MMDQIYLSGLTVERFRNIGRLQMAPKRRFNVISGKNGSGKTNLLEAIYFFSALRSFRTTFRREIIQRGEEATRLSGVFEGAATGLNADIELSSTVKKIKKDGKEVTDICEHFSKIPMVLFHPANMALIRGGPTERRRFMDRALFQAVKAYPSISSDYQRVLSSRNRLLKEGRSDPRMTGPFDAQLAALGAKIIEERKRFIGATAEVFKQAFSTISLGLKGDLEYKPDVEGGETEIRNALEKGLTRDLQRGFTARGPQADDLEVTIKGLSARRFASQGQKRVAVLAMKIAETVALQNVTQRIPIMLLDDISSELDRERNRELFGYLSSVGGQVFITTTHLDHVLIESDRSDFEIENGVLR